MLPPFEGRLVYGTDSETDVYRSWRLSYVEDSLEWFVQERQGLDFRTLPGLFYLNKHDLYGSTSTATRGFDVFEPTQNKDFDYDPPEAAQPSSGHRDNLLVDGRWTNNSSSIAIESSEKLPRPDSLTMNLNLLSGTALGYNIQTSLSPTPAHGGFTIDCEWPLPQAPFSNIYPNAPERRDGRYSESHRTGISAEEVRGYRDQPKVRMPKGPYHMFGPDSDHPYHSKAPMPSGPCARLEPYSDHRNPHLEYTQDRRESLIVETSESLDQKLDDQDFQGEEMACDDAYEYHEATNRITYQADDSPSLHSQFNLGELPIQARRVITLGSESYQSKLGEISLLETDMSECEASESSISRQDQESLQSSQNIYQDTTDIPRWSWEPEDDQVGELVKDGPGVLPLRDQFGEHYQTKVLPPLLLDVIPGNPDSLNYRDHSTGGLTFANQKNTSRRGWFRNLRFRINRRIRGRNQNNSGILSKVCQGPPPPPLAVQQ